MRRNPGVRNVIDWLAAAGYCLAVQDGATFIRPPIDRRGPDRERRTPTPYKPHSVRSCVVGNRDEVRGT